MTLPPPVPSVEAVRGYVVRVKVAVTDCDADIVTVQAAVPVHGPLHPAKVEFEAGVAVNTTMDPSGNPPAQINPQLIPGGVEVTVPWPFPLRTTLNDCRDTSSYAAVTVFAASIVTVHVPVPEQGPDQPRKAKKLNGVDKVRAVRVTTVPRSKSAEQDESHAIPAGSDVIALVIGF